ncbi:MAG TPA: hypothetical protein PKO06_18645, partial [Candidatus Ozemobacteraceae bacterium]|nr:hypothetical protein [Candidatus Ozemobacteraceae bacterium]
PTPRMRPGHHRPWCCRRESERSPAAPGTTNEKAAPRIRCPKCGWQPQAEDRWLCCHRIGPYDACCGHVWNTFDTRGKCPNCHYQWTVTACLSCHQWSAHEDWYESPTTED